MRNPWRTLPLSVSPTPQPKLRTCRATVCSSSGTEALAVCASMLGLRRLEDSHRMAPRCRPPCAMGAATTLREAWSLEPSGGGVGLKEAERHIIAMWPVARGNGTRGEVAGWWVSRSNTLSTNPG